MNSFKDIAYQILKEAKVREYEKHPIPLPSASYGARIDQLVYKLYGLTPEEIKIVERD